MDEWFEDWFDRDYAAIYGHRDGREAEAAVAMALAAAPQLASGPVLDLGCGSGRHLAVAAPEQPSWPSAWTSPATCWPWRRPGCGPGCCAGTCAGCRCARGTLAGICMWFTPFGYFSDPENRALLRSLRELLRPGGVLVLDYLNAPFVRAQLVPEDVAVHGAIRVRSRRALEGDRLVKRMTLTHLDTGAEREALESVRLYEPAELRAMARGLRIHPGAGGRRLPGRGF